MLCQLVNKVKKPVVLEFIKNRKLFLFQSARMAGSNIIVSQKARKLFISYCSPVPYYLSHNVL